MTVPGNCAVFGFSQWTASKFKGWDAYKLSVSSGTPPASSIYSYSISPPAEAECLAMLGRAQAAIPDHKVTTYYRRTSVCATRYKALVKAEKAVKKAKSKKAKKKAKSKLSKTRKTFNKSCTR